MRQIPFVTDNYYHIYNRGVDKREIFLDEKDFTRFIVSMREFNVEKPIGSLYESEFRKRISLEKEAKLPIGSLASPPRKSLVEFVAYCLNPNHYHFIIKQKSDNGIKMFMHKLGTGYTNYFNTKYNRSGSLFQGPFKAKHIDSVKYLTWLSGYVNGNVQIHQIAKAKNHQWSSYQDYLELRKGTLCNKKLVLQEFNNNLQEYEDFVNVVVTDSKDRKTAVKEWLAELE